MSTLHAGSPRLLPAAGRPVPLAAATILICSLWACFAEEASGARDAGTETVVEDSSGVEIVTNHGRGWSVEEAWRLEPELQVGELDGPLAFGRIAWVGPGPDGGMLVLDGQSNRVHRFDSAGQPVATFGGEGDGPGEFRRPSAVTRLADGRLTVAETFPPILHWLAPNGEYERSTRLPIARAEEGTRTAGSFGLWQVTPGGRVFVQVQVIDPDADEGRMPAVLLEVDPDGELPPDTIATWTWQAGFGDEEIRMFEPVTTWMPGPEGLIARSTGAPYEIRWEDSETGLRRLVRRKVEPVAVTETHRRLALRNMRESMLEGGAPEEMVEDMLDRVVFEASVPDVLRVWVSEPDGRLWVGVHDADLFDGDTDTFSGQWANALDVFDPDGAYLGRVPLPPGFQPRVIRERAVYGVWEDDLEVTFARRFSVVRPGD